MNYLVTIKDVVFWLGRNIIWINIILAGVIILFERRNPTETLLWLMALTVLPYFGFIIYLFFGQSMNNAGIFKNKGIEDYTIKNSISLDKIFGKVEKDKDLEKYEDYKDQIDFHMNTSQALFTYGNKIEIFFDGEEKFKSLLKEIRKAKDYIYIEYYIFKDDMLGMTIIDALIEKAREGVDVKLLIDGVGGRHLRKKSIEKLEENGVKVAIFFEPRLGRKAFRLNYRNHRKICVIDGLLAYIGGFNIGDEYIGLDKKFGYWRDNHLLIKGPSVASIQWRFNLDWRFSSNKEDSLIKQSKINNIEDNKGGIQIVSSGPDSIWPNIKDGYLKMVNSSRKSIYIQTPYFIPDDALYEAIRLAAQSGVDVKIMIPNKPDHPFVYWATLSYAASLLDAGAEVYTYEKGFLHCKTIVIDDFVSSIGSANFDIRSFKLNFEVNAFVYDEKTNREIREQFIKDMGFSQKLTLEKYEKRSFIIKFKEAISRLLSPIL